MTLACKILIERACARSASGERPGGRWAGRSARSQPVVGGGGRQRPSCIGVDGIRRSSPAKEGGRGRAAGPAEVAGAGAPPAWRWGMGWAGSGVCELQRQGSGSELGWGRWRWRQIRWREPPKTGRAAPAVGASSGDELEWGRSRRRWRHRRWAGWHRRRGLTAAGGGGGWRRRGGLGEMVVGTRKIKAGGGR